MSKTEYLNRIAEDENVTIMNGNFDKCGSVSLMADSGDCYIGINDKEMTSAERNVHIAHELGHCITGSFYNIHARFDVISKHEYRADKWAIKKIVPKDDLINAFEDGITEIWELANLFEVTEEFMIKACEFYGYYNRAI